MSVIQLTGQFGNYYTSQVNTSEPLNYEYQKINATYISNYLQSKGWTINAISGLLGNAQAESSINPGRWQSDDVDNLSGGYGLVQWTPATKYLDWVGNNPNYIDNNLRRIIYDLENNLQWISTFQYPLSFEAFTHSNDTPENLASAWLKNYERAGVEVEAQRRLYAKQWYDYLGGIQPTPHRKKKNKNFKFVLYARKIRKKSQIN